MADGQIEERKEGRKEYGSKRAKEKKQVGK